MKLKMKRTVGIILAVVLCLSLFTGCTQKSNVADNTIIWYTTGRETTRTADVLAKINEILLEKTGYQVEFRYLSHQAYDLTVSTGEDVDIIQAPDYLNYWPNASKGAFLELTDEDLQKYAPYIWEKGEEYLNLVKVNGERYTIPSLGITCANRCLVARGDMMEKAGIDELDGIESMEKYLDYVKANYPEMIPFDIEGNIPYNLFAFWASDLRWSPVSTVSYASPVYFKLDDPEHKLFIAAEQPETLEFTETMKRWHDKGFFSKSVLSNKNKSVEAFKAGRTALALPQNPDGCQDIFDECSQDDRAAWNVRFFTRYQTSQLNGGVSPAISLGANTQKKEGALKVLNECYANKELYRLVYYGGIEGTDWKEKEDGSIEYLIPSESMAYFMSGLSSNEHGFNKVYTFTGHEELMKKLESITETSPVISMPKNEENVREIVVAMSEVWQQYSTPRCYGVLTKSPKEALAEEVQLLKKAGIETYMEDLQKQIDAFYAGLE